MEEKKSGFKINDSFKTLLKAEIIRIINLMLFIIVCVFAIGKNALHYISCR